MTELYDSEEWRMDVKITRELCDLWRFVRAYDAWAESSELCAGPLFDAMLKAREMLEERCERGRSEG